MLLGIKIRLVGMGVVSLFLAACASTPSMMREPPKAGSQPPSYAVTALDEKELMLGNTIQPLNAERTIVYNQQFGGGGVAVGLLFGPLGVVANAAAIGNRTKEESVSLRGRLGVEPGAVVSEILTKSGDLKLAAEASARISPALELVSTEMGNLIFGCRITVKQSAAEANWKGTYVVVLPDVVRRADLANGLAPERLAELEKRIRAGFADAFALYRQDLQGELKPEGDVHFKTIYLTPRIRFEFVGKHLKSAGDELRVRTGAAVLVLPRNVVEQI